jgi:hypothetical protein
MLEMNSTAIANPLSHNAQLLNEKKQIWAFQNNTISSSQECQLTPLSVKISRFEVPVEDMHIQRNQDSLSILWSHGKFFFENLTDSKLSLPPKLTPQEACQNIEKNVGITLSFYRTDTLQIAIYDFITSHSMWLAIINKQQSCILHGMTQYASLSLN